jgi:hypothetical protein
LAIKDCFVALARVLAMPIFVAVAEALPSVVTILMNKLKIVDMKAALKLYHQKKYFKRHKSEIYHAFRDLDQNSGITTFFSKQRNRMIVGI